MRVSALLPPLLPELCYQGLDGGCLLAGGGLRRLAGVDAHADLQLLSGGPLVSARVLIAKALIAAVLSLAAGAFAVLGSLLIGSYVLTGNGLTVAHGYEITSLANATNLRAAGGTVLYLALIALLSLGVATIVREPAPAIGVVLGLLYVFPLLGAVVSDRTWSRHLQQIGPMTAGLAIEATRNLNGLPLSPWAGLGVLGAWAAGALVLGGLMFRYRDV